MSSYGITEYDVLLKAIVIGDSGVGKSSLLHRYTENDWNPTYIATIGVDFKIDTFETEGKVVKLQMWDTAGQERFKTICAAYYRGAHCIMLVFDVTDRESFVNLRNWIKEVETYARPNVPMVLVGNKSDLTNRQVSVEDAEMFAESYGMQYIETSAKTASNVATAFRQAVSTALDKRMLILREEKEARTLRLKNYQDVNPPQQSCLKRFRTILGL